MTLAFTGHRPEKLPWGTDETDERCAALKIQIRRAVEQSGADTFVCGMARGCDFYFAEAVLESRRSGQKIRLEAYLPCPSQPNHWSAGDRRRYETLLKECDAVYMVEQSYSKGCMLRRNRAMIDRADSLLTVWDGSSGGTQAAVRYAGHRGIPVTGLWL